MNTSILARKLLKWRSERCSTAVPDDLLSPDELQEAIRLRWVECELEEHRHITTYLGRLEEMEVAAKDIAVGDTVTVAEGGQSYTGTVRSVDPEGIRMTFGEKRPPNIDKVYKREEVNPVARPKVQLARDQEPAQPPGNDARHNMFRLATGMMTR
jgi:hypothetical protein